MCGSLCPGEQRHILWLSCLEDIPQFSTTEDLGGQVQCALGSSPTFARLLMSEQTQHLLLCLPRSMCVRSVCTGTGLFIDPQHWDSLWYQRNSPVADLISSCRTP